MKQKIFAFLFILLILFSFLFYGFYNKVYKINIFLPDELTEFYLDIPTDANFDTVVEILNEAEILLSEGSFEWVAKQKKYYYNVKPGRYKIFNNLNNDQLVNLLRSGNQTPIKVTFNNIRTIHDLASNLSKQIELDSATIIKVVTSENFFKKTSFNSFNISSMFIPNTYEFYWNTSSDDFAQRMYKEYISFWNAERLEKAKLIDLKPTEVSVLASIVEKEQNIKTDEREAIAGLYINRIKKNMKLESDPTLVYAIGDFSIKRVLNKDKKVDSPFNTYMYKGLPPGPICIPSIDAIDAVLNYSKHDYIFMCAREDFSGYHNFATNYRDHLKNARKYQKELNKRKIHR